MVSHENILLRDKRNLNFQIETLILKKFKFINLSDETFKK